MQDRLYLIENQGRQNSCLAFHPDYECEIATDGKIEKSDHITSYNHCLHAFTSDADGDRSQFVLKPTRASIVLMLLITSHKRTMITWISTVSWSHLSKCVRNLGKAVLLWVLVTHEGLTNLIFFWHRFQLCQVIACSSLCSIAISWAALLPLIAVKFVLLTLRTLLNILSNHVKCTSAFLYQV